ncbi:MAG: membrane protein insertion efficiency factor YidD [Kiritimatiellae bacterium]|nr:membrane protein insertion efficiency factor YidD [Kiritimatiellia bacterium]
MLLYLCLRPVEAHENSFRGPWSVSAQNPVIFERFLPKNDQNAPKNDQNAQKNTGFSKKYGGLALNFYQNTLSVVVRSACPMEPSCSNYARDAVKKHGLGRGLLLIMDRLLRENSEGYYAPLVKTETRGYKYYDPVENSDFWWKKSKK